MKVKMAFLVLLLALIMAGCQPEKSKAYWCTMTTDAVMVEDYMQATPTMADALQKGDQVLATKKENGYLYVTNNRLVEGWIYSGWCECKEIKGAK